MRFEIKCRRLECGHQVECLLLTTTLAMTAGIALPIGRKIASLGYTDSKFFGTTCVLIAMFVISISFGLIVAVMIRRKSKEETFFKLWIVSSIWTWVTQPWILLVIGAVYGVWRTVT